MVICVPGGEEAVGGLCHSGWFNRDSKIILQNEDTKVSTPCYRSKVHSAQSWRLFCRTEKHTPRVQI